MVDAAAAGAAAEALAEFIEVFGGASGDNFDVAIFGVADPAPKIEFAGFAVNEPAEAYSLYAALDEEVENHVNQSQSFKHRRYGARRLWCRDRLG